jgi:hypothetical protein
MKTEKIERNKIIYQQIQRGVPTDIVARRNGICESGVLKIWKRERQRKEANNDENNNIK